jgi:hypothetical protein
MSQPLMMCGHAANATHNGDPACVICVGIDPGALVIDASPPDLTGRLAKCSYCGSERPSSTDLPFFEHRESGDYYYCGCRGWD